MSCTYCRARHYKCDENLPKCKRCERAGRRCIREPPRRFRHFDAPTRPRQPQIWLPIPPNVDFIDETASIVEGIDDPDSSQEEQDQAAAAAATPQPVAIQVSEAAVPEAVPETSLQQLNHSSEPGTEPGPSVADSTGLTPAVASPFNNYSHRSRSYASSPTYNALRELGRSQTQVFHEPPPPITRSSSQLSQSWLKNQWPLQSDEEAMLLRFYLDHISTFFDLCEPYRYFRFEVPQRARTNKTLANAILALSARMLHWKTGYNPYVADRYYQLCLETLIPSLSDLEAVMDETLLAATVVLRMLEEMDVHVTGTDTQGHLTGSQAIIRASSSAAAHHPPRGLRRSAYWSAFRQEVWIAPQTQQPIRMSPAACGYDVEHSFSPAPDWVWCERGIAHCGAAMNATLSSGVHQLGVGKGEQVERWRALMEENARWWRCVPDTFEPFFGGWAKGGGAREGDGGEPFFPDVRFQADWHVMGYSYTIEAHLLLVVHDPTIPKLGPLRRRVIADVDEKARQDVRNLCGLARSNSFSPSASLIASMAIALCGDRFTKLEEQRQLYGFLYQTEKSHGWPTAKARAQLQEAWGWEANGSMANSPAGHSLGAAITPP